MCCFMFDNSLKTPAVWAVVYVDKTCHRGIFKDSLTPSRYSLPRFSPSLSLSVLFCFLFLNFWPDKVVRDEIRQFLSLGLLFQSGLKSRFKISLLLPSQLECLTCIKNIDSDVPMAGHAGGELKTSRLVTSETTG